MEEGMQIMKMLKWTAVVVGAWAFTAVAAAQAPARVPLQGYLTNTAGMPVDGDVDITLALYDVATGGTAVHTETQTITVSAGEMTAYIGDGAALDLTLFRDSAALYLGIAVGADPEMSPRPALGTVPFAAYAEYAGDANSLRGRSPADLRDMVVGSAQLTALLDERLCERMGGNWNGTTCDEFMRRSTATTNAGGRWATCRAEFGASYAPCNSFEALALSNLYEVPNHEYYWLHAGGTEGQSSVQTLWRDFPGSNTISSQLNCPATQTVGYFHSWDNDHVDSLSCLANATNYRVLCCRRN